MLARRSNLPEITHVTRGRLLRCASNDCVGWAPSVRAAALGTAAVLFAWSPSVTVAAPLSCAAAIGKTQAKVLVDRCLEVSPATHPPCNALNPCDLIIDEIHRGCAFLQSAQQPRFCAQYPDHP